MRIWGKLVAAAVAPLLLTGCLWGPGKFTSSLALNKAGTFVLDYKGEIMLHMPDGEGTPKPWDDAMAICYADGRVETGVEALPVVIEPTQDVAPDERSEDPGPNFLSASPSFAVRLVDPGSDGRDDAVGVPTVVGPTPNPSPGNCRIGFTAASPNPLPLGEGLSLRILGRVQSKLAHMGHQAAANSPLILP